MEARRPGDATIAGADGTDCPPVATVRHDRESVGPCVIYLAGRPVREVVTCAACRAVFERLGFDLRCGARRGAPATAR